KRFNFNCMKKYLVIIMVALSPLMTQAQSIFDKYAENSEVTYVALQPKMFQMLSKISVSSDDPDAQAVYDLVNNITSFKVITTEKVEITRDLDDWGTKHLSKSNFEELMLVRDGDANVRYSVKEVSDDFHVEYVIMMVTDLNYQDLDIACQKPEIALLSLTGNIGLRQLSKLTSKMDMPG